MSGPAKTPVAWAELRERIGAARGGSGEALGTLLAACRDYLLLVANRELEASLRAKISPSDVVQETFVEAQQNFGGFVGQSEQELLAWLRRILVNNLSAARRKYLGTQCRNINLEISLDDSKADVGAAAALVAKLSTPSKHALLTEQLRSVAQVLATLPADYQQVLTLRYWERLSVTQIAGRMGRTPDAVQKLWFRAIDRFKREFKQDGES